MYSTRPLIGCDLARFGEGGWGSYSGSLLVSYAFCIMLFHKISVASKMKIKPVDIVMALISS